MARQVVYSPNSPHFPVVRVLDGDGYHFTPDALKKLLMSGLLFCSPNNTTRQAQPLDVSFFWGLLKGKYRGKKCPFFYNY